MQETLAAQLRAEMIRKWDNAALRAAQTPTPPSPEDLPEKVEPTPAPVQVHRFPVTNNLSRAAFLQVQSQPETRAQVTQRLVEKGYKPNSVSSILGNMIKQRVALVDAQGVMRVQSGEYVPLKSSASMRNAAKKLAQAQKRAAQREKNRVQARRVYVPVPTPPTPAPVAAPVPEPALTPELFVLRTLESLTVLQARAVYDELRKIFGDAK